MLANCSANKYNICKYLIGGIYLFGLSIISAFATGTSDTLQFKLLGAPLTDRQKEAQQINTLCQFKDRLYIGYGDAVANTGPTDVIYYHMQSNKFVTEFTIDEEAIYSYSMLDGKLCIPGIDNTEDSYDGNIYIYENSKWKKVGNIPNAVHIMNAVSYHGEWYLATGNVFEQGERQLYAIGGIIKSPDQGETWQLVHSTPADVRRVYRFNQLSVFQDKLFAFFYAIKTVPGKNIPHDQQPYMGKAYQGNHMLFVQDPLGSADTLVFSGGQWHYIDLFANQKVCVIKSIKFKDYMILYVISGEYIDYSTLKNGLPDSADSTLYAFDGKGMGKIDVKKGIIKSWSAQEDRLYMLIQTGDKYYIAVTEDAGSWKYYEIPHNIQKAKCIEYHKQKIYIGTEEGDIYVAEMND